MRMNKYRFPHESEIELFILKSDGSHEVATIKSEKGNVLGIYSKTLLGLNDAIELKGSYDDIALVNYSSEFNFRGFTRLSVQVKSNGICVCNPDPHDQPLLMDDPDLFIDWYSETKLKPHIKENTCIIYAFERYKLNSYSSSDDAPRSITMSNLISVYAATSYPEVTLSDLKEYAQYTFLGPDSLPPLVKLVLKVRTRLKRRRWLGTYEGEGNQIDDLYQKLIGQYINCTLEVFRGVFGIGKYKRPVKWLGKQNELVFFTKELQNQGFLDKTKSQDWELLRVMFVRKSGELFNDNFKSIWQNLESKVSKKFQDSIKKLLYELDQPLDR